MPRTRLERMQAIRERLLKQGALLGTVDAFEAAVRELEDEYIAKMLREVADDQTYSVGRMDKDTTLAIANEIENLRS